jgi:hypothetical protein
MFVTHAYLDAACTLSMTASEVSVCAVRVVASECNDVIVVVVVCDDESDAVDGVDSDELLDDADAVVAVAVVSAALVVV